MAKLIDTKAAVISTRCPAGPRRVEPVTSSELVRDGVNPELLASLALRRVSGGGVAKSGGHYFEWGHPTVSYLTEVFDELVSTRLLSLAEEDPCGLRRVSFTPAGHVRYVQLSAMPVGAPLRVPNPSFPPPRLVAGRIRSLLRRFLAPSKPSRADSTGA